MTDQEQWLAANTINCERFRARMTPGACNDYRSAYPERCAGCETMAADPAKALQWGSEERAIRAQKLSVVSRKGKTEMKKKSLCAECDREMIIIGRGLCGGCYAKVRKAEAMAEQTPPPQEVEVADHDQLGQVADEMSEFWDSEPSPTSAPVAVDFDPVASTDEDLANAIMELLFPAGIPVRHIWQGLQVANEVKSLLTKTWGMRWTKRLNATW